VIVANLGDRPLPSPAASAGPVDPGAGRATWPGMNGDELPDTERGPGGFGSTGRRCVRPGAPLGLTPTEASRCSGNWPPGRASDRLPRLTTGGVGWTCLTTGTTTFFFAAQSYGSAGPDGARIANGRGAQPLPYIPRLAFLRENSRRRARPGPPDDPTDLLACDGQGLAHPRRFGGLSPGRAVWTCRRSGWPKAG
jgi:hypothetical protein